MRTIVKGKEEKKSIIFKIREDDKIKILNQPFINYFYILTEDFDNCEFLIDKYLSNTEEVFDLNNVSYTKLYFNNNMWDRNNVRKVLENELQIKTFEADINSVKRFILDNPNLELNQQGLKKVFLDIETDDRFPMEKDFKGNVIPNSSILSIALKNYEDGKIIKFFINKAKYDDRFAVYIDAMVRKDKQFLLDNKDKISHILYEYELILLKEIFNCLKDYDVAFAWYGRGFDFPFIQERAKLHGLNYYDLMIVDMDFLEVHKKNTWDSLESYSLNNVSKHEFKGELGKEDSQFNNLSEITKIDWKEKTGLTKYFELYALEDKMFKEYNIQDINLMYLIEQKLKMIEIHNIQSKISHCLLIETLYNSHSCDSQILAEYHKRGMIADSKPNEDELNRRKDPLTGEFPSGGFTRCFVPKLHKGVDSFDFKSEYPTQIITYNISPETFVKNVFPVLENVFNEQEILLINTIVNNTKKYLNKKGELIKGKYNKFILEQEEKYKVGTMKSLMWRFVKSYKNPELEKECKENDTLFTPADLNLDTRGWAIHPHRIFTRKEGVVPKICRSLIIERDKAKYELKNLEFKSPEWWRVFNYQLALKINANSLFGFLGYKKSRFFCYDVCDTITTVSRFLTKSVILKAKEYDYISVLTDTDSAYLKSDNSKFSIKEMECVFYYYFDEYIKPYNTFCEIELTHPLSGEKEIKNHFIVFEHEENFPSLIAVKKKRYYYKYLKDGKYLYDTKGGAYKKTDTVKIAREWQKKLTTDILDDNFNMEEWKNKILELKEKVFNFELEEEMIINYKGISKNPNEYGQATIDSKTNQPKIKKDGSIQFTSIPCHVKIAKEMIERGEEVNIGDKIPYIIINGKTPMKGISIEEYRKKPTYDVMYYWERIFSPLIEILNVTHPEECYTYFAECWNFTERQLKKKYKDNLEYLNSDLS